MVVVGGSAVTTLSNLNLSCIELELGVEYDKSIEKAGAELGQAQVKDEAVVLVEVVDEVGVQLLFQVGGRIKQK